MIVMDLSSLSPAIFFLVRFFGGGEVAKIWRKKSGVFLAMILTITAGLRALVRFVTAPLRLDAWVPTLGLVSVDGTPLFIAGW